MTIASAIATKQQQVADSYTAVSNKGGTLPATQNLTNLATAISSIPSGGGGSATSIDPVQYTTSYNLASTYDATSLAAAEILHVGNTSSAAIGGAYTTINATNAIMAVAETGISTRYYDQLVTVNCPQLKYIIGNTWWTGGTSHLNSKLTNFNFPELIGAYIKGYLVQYCSALTLLNLPKLKISADIVSICGALEKLKVPNFEHFIRSSYLASGCGALKYINAPKFSDNIDSVIINNGCGNLECLILGDIKEINTRIMHNTPTYTNFTTYVFNVTQVPTLADVTYVRYSTAKYPHFASNGDGKIYVPDALVDTFKAATNWATLAEFIKPISQFNNTWE